MSSPTTDTSPVAIITGASSGIGLATATRLATRGWSLVLAARTADRLDEARAHASEAGARDAIGVPTHVEDPDQAARLVDRAVDHCGRIDAIVTAAGYAQLAPIDGTTPESLQQAFAINALAPGYLIARAWPVLTRQSAGCIVNISSMATQDPFPGFFAYAASKAAVNLMTRSCAKEGAEHGIRAFAVAPGAVETPMLRSLFTEDQIPREATLDPDDVAARVTACIDGEHDEHNGEVIWMPNA